MSEFERIAPKYGFENVSSSYGVIGPTSHAMFVKETPGLKIKFELTQRTMLGVEVDGAIQDTASSREAAMVPVLGTEIIIRAIALGYCTDVETVRLASIDPERVMRAVAKSIVVRNARRNVRVGGSVALVLERKTYSEIPESMESSMEAVAHELDAVLRRYGFETSTPWGIKRATP